MNVYYILIYNIVVIGNFWAVFRAIFTLTDR